MEEVMVGNVYNRKHAPRTRVALNSVEILEMWCSISTSYFCMGCVQRMGVVSGGYISLELKWTPESGAWCVPHL